MSTRARNVPAAGQPTEQPGQRATSVDIRWFLALTAAALVATPLVYLFASRQAANNDPFVYATLAKEVLAGKRLYADTWQDKPPLAIFAYAVPQLFFPRSYSALAFFGGLAIGVQAVMFAWAFRDGRAAAVACVLFVTLFPMTNWDFIWPSTEHFANVFVAGNVLIALAIVRNRTFSLLQCLAVGAFACAAFHIRQNIVLSGAFPGLMMLMTPRPVRDKLLGAVAMLAGAGLAWIPVLALVFAYCDLGGYFWTIFVYPRAYASAGSLDRVIRLGGLLWETPLPFMMALFAGLAATERYRWLVLAAVVVGVGSCTVPMRTYGHYWVNSFPYVALLMGLTLERVAQTDARRAWIYASAVAVAIVPMAAVRLHLMNQQPTQRILERVAQTVDRVAPEGATLMVCGSNLCESIQFASKLPAANKYSWVNQFQAPWANILPEPLATIFDSYAANPPTVIVIDDQSYQRAMLQPGPLATPEYLRLVRRLASEHPYKLAASEEGFLIAVRQPK